MSATNLLELTPDEIVALVEGLGQPAYRGRQLATWVYVKGVADFGAMTDLPRDLRDALAALPSSRRPWSPRATSPATGARSSTSGSPTAGRSSRWSCRTATA